MNVCLFYCTQSLDNSKQPARTEKRTMNKLLQLLLLLHHVRTHSIYTRRQMPIYTTKYVQMEYSERTSCSSRIQTIFFPFKYTYLCDCARVRVCVYVCRMMIKLVSIYRACCLVSSCAVGDSQIRNTEHQCTVFLSNTLFVSLDYCRLVWIFIFSFFPFNSALLQTPPIPVHEK